MENDLLTNLNYFFSTSPQVLGAILAITGAYVVFKLESLKDGLNSYSQKMIDLGKPISEGELNKAMKKMELHEMIIENTDVKQRRFLFGVKGEEFKYAQMGRRFHEIESIINDEIKPHIKAIYDKGWMITKQKEKFDSLLAICDDYLNQKVVFDSFIKKTISTYILNGLLLGVLLSAFLFLPCIGKGNGYWIALVSGIIITWTSLALIIKYIVCSFRLGNEKK